MPRDIPERYTADMIAAVIGSLDEQCARLRAVKEFMETAEIESLEVKNSISLKKRGIPILTAFTQAAVDALRDHRLGGQK